MSANIGRRLIFEKVNLRANKAWLWNDGGFHGGFNTIGLTQRACESFDLHSHWLAREDTERKREGFSTSQ
jgi:hypothetical protein